MCTDADDLIAEPGHLGTASRRRFVRSGHLAAGLYRIDVVLGTARAGGDQRCKRDCPIDGEHDDLSGVSDRIVTEATTLRKQSTNDVHWIMSTRREANCAHQRGRCPVRAVKCAVIAINSAHRAVKSAQHAVNSTHHAINSARRAITSAHPAISSTRSHDGFANQEAASSCRALRCGVSQESSLE